MKRVLFLSVRPKYAAQILQGTKTVDLRRLYPTVSKGDKVVLYISSPTKAVQATATVESISCAEPSKLWKEVRDRAGVTRVEFDDYFSDAAKGVAIHIKNVQKLKYPIPLSTLRQLWPNFRPPQSYRYFSVEELARLRNIQPRSR